MSPIISPNSIPPMCFGNAAAYGKTRARPWLYEPYLVRGQVTTIAPHGAPGAGFPPMHLAIRASLGLPYLGQKSVEGVFRTLVCIEYSERLQWDLELDKTCDELGFDPVVVRRNILSWIGVAPILPGDADAVVDAALANEIALIITGPLYGDSNEEVLWQRIARKADVAALAYFEGDPRRPREPLYFHNRFIEDNPRISAACEQRQQ